MDLELIVERLCDPAVYPEPTTRVDLLQTHISYVFLTDRFVYKVKKAVNFGFLDYTTREKRRHFCEREVELNARLCPDVYLGVVPIFAVGGEPSFAGEGEPVEYAVKMVRLPADRMLREVLGRGEGSPEIFRSIALTLASFHERAETGLEIQAMKGLAGVAFNCEENFQQTEKYVGHVVPAQTFERIRTSTRLFLRRRAGLFEARAQRGRVRDGHGDLHLDSICVTEPIRIFDCIEFNERFRYQDVAEEVGFLAMDLEFHGFCEYARVFVDAYQEASGDREMIALLDFYKAYRAYVRAKVSSFATDDQHISDDLRARLWETARRYYALAESYAARFNPQLLVMTCGLTGTGKSTLARMLGERYCLEVVRSDVVRKELLGLNPYERRWDAFNQGAYDAAMTDRTYAAMVERSELLLRGGHSVILDGCFIRRDQRRAVLELAERSGVSLLLLECQAPAGLVRERLDGRSSRDVAISDGRWEIYSQQLASFEPPEEVPPDGRVVLDRSRPVEEHVAALAARLPAEWMDA
ncbi:MAG: AAA family ATPase [Acidobacteriota bacterium]